MGKPNTTRYALLGLLSLGPSSGYDIKKLIAGSVAHFWNESFGQIYPILRRLEAEGLAARRRERQAGKPDRQVYTLTPRGLDELRGWLEHPPSRETFRSELLLKLFLGGHASPEARVRHVRQFRQQQSELLGAYGEIGRRLGQDHADHPDLPYWRLTLDYGRRRAEALLRWSEATLRALEGLQRRKARVGRRRARASR